MELSKTVLAIASDVDDDDGEINFAKCRNWTHKLHTRIQNIQMSCSNEANIPVPFAREKSISRLGGFVMVRTAPTHMQRHERSVTRETHLWSDDVCMRVRA